LPFGVAWLPSSLLWSCDAASSFVRRLRTMKITSYKDVLVLMALVGGILLSVAGFVLFFTDHGSPVILESIGITVALMLGILFWFGLGLAGILRAVGYALVASGVFCIVFKPLPSVVCLLVGIACRLAAAWVTRHIRQSDSRKI
jgi:uncharacterized membrane protein